MVAEAVGHPGSLMLPTSASVCHTFAKATCPGPPLVRTGGGDVSGGGLQFCFPGVSWALGLAYMLGGRVADALVLLEQAVEQSASLARWANRSISYRWAKPCYRPATWRRRHRAGQALELAHVHKERSREAWALRLFGGVAAQEKTMFLLLTGRYCLGQQSRGATAMHDGGLRTVRGTVVPARGLAQAMPSATFLAARPTYRTAMTSP